MHRAEVGDDMLGSVGSHQGDEISTTDPQRNETGCNLYDTLPVLSPRELFPNAVLTPMNGRDLRMFRGIPSQHFNNSSPLHHCVDIGANFVLQSPYESSLDAPTVPSSKEL